MQLGQMSKENEGFNVTTIVKNNFKNLFALIATEADFLQSLVWGESGVKFESVSALHLQHVTVSL